MPPYWNVKHGQNYQGHPVLYLTLAEGVKYTPEQAQALVDEFHSEAIPAPPGYHWALQVCCYIAGPGWTSGRWRNVLDGSPLIKDMSRGSDGTGPERNVVIESIQIWRVRIRN